MQRNSLDKLKTIKGKINNLDSRLSVLEGKDVTVIPDTDSFEHATYYDFLSPEDIKRINKEFNDSLNKGVECDALDYALAAASGILCGLVDIMFVKTPHNSTLGNAVDNTFDDAIKGLVKKIEINQTGETKDRSVASAIGYLERMASVSYDQAKTQEITKMLANGFTDTVEHLSAKNHHAKSLSHYPDIIGLIASISNQFTNTATFLDNNKGGITIINGTGNNIELLGDTLPAKVYCGFINWFLHCLSDVAGSSGSRGNGGTGMGLPIPFTEFFQFCNFGQFPNEKGQYQSFATVMTKVYEEGYDLRHGVATTFPVILNSIIIRALYVIKQHFYNKAEWKDLINLKTNPTLSRMVTVGDGALCLMDLSEAAITSWGNWVVFFSHLNISAWAKLGKQGLVEIKNAANQDMKNIEDMQQQIDKDWEDLLNRSIKLSRYKHST
ncbi:MAG: hypothetical protein IKF29_00230 [Oceanobacillus sp.]|nr:hypothetical protein [Oceanobacillus sp.]